MQAWSESKLQIQGVDNQLPEVTLSLHMHTTDLVPSPKQ